jgi:hypothetical protein
MALASSVEEQLVELRAWSFVAVVFWHSVACLAFVRTHCIRARALRRSDA